MCDVNSFRREGKKVVRMYILKKLTDYWACLMLSRKPLKLDDYIYYRILLTVVMRMYSIVLKH